MPGEEFARRYTYPTELAGKRMLSVDDREVNRTILARQLAAQGMGVSNAGSGAEALTQAAGRKTLAAPGGVLKTSAESNLYDLR